jgi:histidinol-phosphatase
MGAFDLDRIGGHNGLHDLVDAVIAAGELAMAHWHEGAGHRATRKPDRSPVTEADHAVEVHLRAFLQERFPNAAFVGEETGASGDDAALCWIVDPIDGTRAFTRGIPTWAILVGLEADGEPVVGVAHFPADGTLLVGVRGEGARIDDKPCVLSKVSSLDDALVSHGGLHQFVERGCPELLPRLGERTFAQRGFGDFDGYRQLLLGRVDAMVDPGVKPWDVCPAAVLVREAGGRLTDFTGIDTIHGGDALATNGYLHDALLALVKGAR